MKIPKKVERDFLFLTSVKIEDTLGIEHALRTVYSENGFSALECWYALDTLGKKLPCKEPDLLDRAIASKKTWNLSIKMMAEDWVNYLFFKEDLKNLPIWVQKAIVNLAQKIAQETIGWIPKRISL